MIDKYVWIPLSGQRPNVKMPIINPFPDYQL